MTGRSNIFGSQAAEGWGDEMIDADALRIAFASFLFFSFLAFNYR